MALGDFDFIYFIYLYFVVEREKYHYNCPPSIRSLMSKPDVPSSEVGALNIFVANIGCYRCVEYFIIFIIIRIFSVSNF